MQTFADAHTPTFHIREAWLLNPHPRICPSTSYLRHSLIPGRSSDPSAFLSTVRKTLTCFFFLLLSVKASSTADWIPGIMMGERELPCQIWGFICLQRWTTVTMTTVVLKVSHTFFCYCCCCCFLVEGKTDEALSHWAKIMKGVCFPTRENIFKLRQTQSWKIPQLIQHDWHCVCLSLSLIRGSHGGRWWISKTRVNTAPSLCRALGSPWGSSHVRGRRQMTI